MDCFEMESKHVGMKIEKKKYFNDCWKISSFSDKKQLNSFGTLAFQACLDMTPHFTDQQFALTRNLSKRFAYWEIKWAVLNS